MDVSLRLMVVFLVVVTAGSTGCDTAADLVLPPAEEEKLGDKVEAQFHDASDVTLYEGMTANEYIDELGRKAVEAAGDDVEEEIEYEFKVIDAPDTVNAFAMPGGQIYFYTGLLQLAENEAEVMSVMCHEVAHVTRRHIAKRLVATYGAQALIDAALGENPGLVAKLAAAVAAKGALLKYSRDHESEADEYGIGYAIRAGYDPHGFVTFFQKLKEQSGNTPDALKWLSSHPLPEDRVEAAREQIGNQTFDDARIGRERHQEVLESLEHGGTGDMMVAEPEPDVAGSESDAADAGM